MGVGIDAKEAQVLLEAEVGSPKRKPRKRSVKYLDGAKEVRKDFTRPGRVKVLYDTGDVYEGRVMPSVGNHRRHDHYKGVLSRNGKGLYVWKNRNALYEGEYKRDIKNGKGRYVAPNGDVFVGDFVDGQKCGKGEYIYATGGRYVGSWLDGKRHGKGVFIFADGEEENVEFVHGKRVERDGGVAVTASGQVASRQNSTFTKTKHNPVGLAMAGGPATGKSTQAQLLAEVLGLVCVNPVALVDVAVTTQRSRLDRQIAACVDEGYAVPDELLVRLVFQRLKRKDVRTQGFVLVDFPKTVAQARLLEDLGVVVDRFIHLSVSNEDMHDRASGRRQDPKTGRVYHLAFKPPPPELLSSVIPLSKDSKGQLMKRLRHHTDNIEGVMDHYKGKVLDLDASAQENGVLDDIRHSLYHSKSPVGIIIAGPPGAGKGTQSVNIRDKHGLVHLSSGDLLRAEIRNGTDEGKTAKKFMDAGELVPAELVVGIIKKRLAQEDVRRNGFLLDGFPRQLEEAQALLDMGVQIDLYLVLDVPEKKLVERVLGRQVDPETGNTYHEKHNPAPASIRARLKTRVDDTLEKLQRRLRTFDANVGSIKRFFGKRVHIVNGDAHINHVNEQVEDAVQRMLWQRIKEGLE